MNDDELMASVRAPFATLHMDTPLEHITARGQRLRWRRRRLPALAAAATGIAAAAVVGVAFTPGADSGQTSSSAWAVERGPDNTVHVTISTLEDPVGLQRALAADGVPAIVTFTGQLCDGLPYRAIPGNDALIRQAVTRNSPRERDYFFDYTIHPAAIPPGTQLDIALMFFTANGHTAAPGVGAVDFGLWAPRLVPLYDPQCETSTMSSSSSPTR